MAIEYALIFLFVWVIISGRFYYLSLKEADEERGTIYYEAMSPIMWVIGIPFVGFVCALGIPVGFIYWFLSGKPYIGEEFWNDDRS